jgi:hypothetical protein
MSHNRDKNRPAEQALDIGLGMSEPWASGKRMKCHTTFSRLPSERVA